MNHVQRAWKFTGNIVVTLFQTLPEFNFSLCNCTRNIYNFHILNIFYILYFL